MSQHDEQVAPARPAGDNHYWGPWAVRPEALSIIAEAARRGVAREAAADMVAAYGRDRDATVPVTGGVAVLSLRGLITPYPSFYGMLFGGGGGLVMFREMFRAAVADDAISAILIDVDSPGGSIDLLPETAAEIREARGTKPIVALANTMAASAAYWIAAQADEVVVTPSGQVGSIGVFLLHAEFSGMDTQMGVTTTLIRAGRYKAEANPYKPLSEEARAALQAGVDEYYEMFLADVAAGRRASVDQVRDGYGEGRMASAQRAIGIGLADRVATFDETVARLAAGGGTSRRARAFARDGNPTLPDLDSVAFADAVAASLAEKAADDSAAPSPEPEPDGPDADPEAEPAGEPDDTDTDKDPGAKLTEDDRRRIAALFFP